MTPQDNLTAERAAKHCCARVYDRWRIDVSGHQCTKPAKVETGGKWYCKVHDPEAVKRREKASYDRYQKQFENRLKYTETAYQAALQTARHEALREAAQQARFGAMELRAINEPLQTDALGYGQKALQDFADILDRLASEGG